MRDQLQAYISTQASNGRAYLRQEAVIALCGWAPSLPGIALRGLAYRLILHAAGPPAIEQGVRLRYAENIRLGRQVYLDYGVYLHACPGGITIGDDTIVMHGTILHVYNFRDLPHAGITIGARCIVGERSVIRGQGGVTLGAGAIVTDGVHIGRNAVIGAGAVVTRDVPAGAVAVGIPARVVRELPDGEPPVDTTTPLLHAAQGRHTGRPGGRRWSLGRARPARQAG